MTQSQHYAGTAFDVGQKLSDSQRASLRSSAINSGIGSYVEPARLTPMWVHFDKRFGKPACSIGGFLTLRRGLTNTIINLKNKGYF